jgi:hypothetical protein
MARASGVAALKCAGDVAEVGVPMHACELIHALVHVGLVRAFVCACMHTRRWKTCCACMRADGAEERGCRQREGAAKEQCGRDQHRLCWSDGGVQVVSWRRR